VECKEVVRRLKQVPMRKYIVLLIVTALSLNYLTAQILPAPAHPDFTDAVSVGYDQPYALDEAQHQQGDRAIHKPWSISLFYGRTIGDPAAKWEGVLKENDFNDYASSLFSWRRTAYPQYRRKIDWQLRLDYRYLPNRAYGLMLHQSSSGTVTGYNEEPFNSSLKIHYGMLGMGVYHQWFFGSKNNFNVYAGPMLNRTKLSFETILLPTSSPSSFDAWKLGLTTGLQVSLIEQEKIYLRVNPEYRYLQALQSGSLSILVNEYDHGVKSESMQLAIPAEETSFSSFSLSIALGFRMGSSH
jgi:hypothetical protein